MPPSAGPSRATINRYLSERDEGFFPTGLVREMSGETVLPDA